MEYSQVIENWKNFSEAICEIGGEVQALNFEKPASTEEVEQLEHKLGFQLPPSLKSVLLEFSSKVEFRWFFPDGYELEGELGEILAAIDTGL